MTKTFFKYVIPSMLAFALSGIYAIVDGFFVGNSIGDQGLATINLVYPLLIAVSLLLTLVYLPLNKTLLHLLGMQGQLEIYGLQYMRVITAGILFQVLGVGLVPLIRNMGKSLQAMAAMIAGFLTNIVLDYLLVWVLPYGLPGAAAATVLTLVGLEVLNLIFGGLGAHRTALVFSAVEREAIQEALELLRTRGYGIVSYELESERTASGIIYRANLLLQQDPRILVERIA